MRQITVRQARRELSEAKIKDWIPCEIVSDGQVIAWFVEPYDSPSAYRVAQAGKTKHDVAQADDDVKQAKDKSDVYGAKQILREINDVAQATVTQSIPPTRRKRKQVKSDDTGLRFSKAAQAAGRMRQCVTL